MKQQQKVQIRYSTGWRLAVVHYEATNALGSCNGWTDADLQEGILCLPSDAERIEFVFKDKLSNLWDNPPRLNRLNRSNYLVDLEKRNCEELLVVVADGEAAAVYVDPKGANKVLIVTDLDGTLIGHDEYLASFKKHWTLHHFWRGSKLVYNTGRNLKDFLNAAGEHRLPKPDFAILGVGTEVYTFPGVSAPDHSHFCSLLTPEEQEKHQEDMAHRGECWPEWCPERLFAKLEKEWIDSIRHQFSRKEAEEFIRRELEGEFYINGNAFHDPMRLSVSIPVSLLEQHIKDPHSSFCSQLKRGYKVCISGGGDWRYLDLLPKNGGKLGATLFVMRKLGFTPERTMVCGDSGNDIDMFAHPTLLGCCVGNAHEVLVTFLKKQAKVNYQTSAGNGPSESPTEMNTNPTSKRHPDSPQQAAAMVDAGNELEGEEPFFLRDMYPTPNVHLSKQPRKYAPWS
ncbi:sucrose-6f-phosphate phosphohydrolase [Cyclospora cayetanensis]|uniref:Sucrose-6f-phosphate phosphohydrolase n=1 Tax=Cyclospora cayetanensis TaxID=88456 RepID=A0A1D3D6D3_9EIME|nr:sucrose-6f-phosphate phosphohydrolase [Cyclospora cayetanensis]